MKAKLNIEMWRASAKQPHLKKLKRKAGRSNPGRYVGGVAPGEAVSDEDFKEQLEELNEKKLLNAQHAGTRT